MSNAITPLRRGLRVFDRYILHRMVGRGGMGVVWLAQDDKLDRPVALKFLPEVLFRDPAARDDLKRETRRSLDLTHPHIVRIHDFIEDEDMAAIAMEYVDGPTLAQLRVDRSSRFFEPEDLKMWTSALCAALEYAHGAGRCVHRDLKPSNVMVSARGVLKVADFGIACGFHYTAARVSVVAGPGGTLGYMSPQQLLGELATPSDDIYSVGAMLFELLTGKPPFHSGDLALQVREVRPEGIHARRQQFGLTGGPIPRAWEETIAACLAKHAHERPRTAREIAQRLELPASSCTEISPALADALPPTLCTPLVPPRPASKARVGKFLWPVVTVAALLTGSVPWFFESAPPATKVTTTAAVSAPVESAPVSVPPLPAPEDSSATRTPAGEDHAFLAEKPSAVLTPQSAPSEPSARGEEENAGKLPRGVLIVTSQPAGAEVFCDDQFIGTAPLDLLMVAGPHTVGARWQGRTARVRTITMAADGRQTVPFDFRPAPAPRGKSRRAEPADDSVWDKMGRSLNKLFTGDKKTTRSR